MARRLGVQLTKRLQILRRHIIAAQVQPTVEKHRTMSGGEHETVAVQPPWLRGIVDEGVAVKDRADFGCTQR